jgi:hypothetical protein
VKEAAANKVAVDAEPPKLASEPREVAAPSRPVSVRAASLSWPRAATLAFAVLGFGFISGYGVGYGVRQPVHKATAIRAAPAAAMAPVVKGMHVSPDGRWLAFTAVYDRSRRSSRFVLDLRSGRFSALESPTGWQDYVVDWAPDGRSLLIEREKIPRPVAEARAGFYRQRILVGAWPRLGGELESLTPTLPPGERLAAGFPDSRGGLFLKTRREPQSLFAVRGGKGQKVDSAPGEYWQNHAVVEGGRSVLYVVRAPAKGQEPALMRVANGRATRLSEPLRGLEWAYIAEGARWMLAARYDDNNVDWRWSLFRVSPQRASRVKSARVPADAIGVYWSPDKRRVLGALGNSLWVVGVPSMQVREIRDSRVANADDAAWSRDSKVVWLAVDGKIRRVDAVTGAISDLWSFPDNYWI